MMARSRSPEDDADMPSSKRQRPDFSFPMPNRSRPITQAQQPAPTATQSSPQIPSSKSRAGTVDEEGKLLPRPTEMEQYQFPFRQRDIPAAEMDRLEKAPISELNGLSLEDFDYFTKLAEEGRFPGGGGSYVKIRDNLWLEMDEHRFDTNVGAIEQLCAEEGQDEWVQSECGKFEYHILTLETRFVAGKKPTPKRPFSSRAFVHHAVQYFRFAAKNLTTHQDLADAFNVLKKTQFNCNTKMDKNASWLAFILGADQKISPLLYYTDDRYRLMMAALDAGTADFEEQWGLFSRAIAERARASNAGHMGVFTAQEEYHSAWHSEDLRMEYMSDWERKRLESAYSTVLELKASANAPTDADEVLGMNFFLTLARKKPAIVSDSPLGSPFHELPGCKVSTSKANLAGVNRTEFKKNLAFLQTKEGFRALRRGLETMGLAHHVSKLRGVDGHSAYN